MKSKKTGLNIIGVFLGLIVATAGVFIMIKEWFPEIIALPYVLLGVGSGIFGQSLGFMIQASTVRKHPAEARKIEIEQKDERNQLIINMAKSKAYDAMIYIYSVLILIFCLLNAGKTEIFLLIGAYLLVIGMKIFYFTKLYKEM